MRLSQAYIPTQKEIPADAVIPSHQLMIRAGLVRPLAAGIYSYLPLGWRIMKKVMTIIREEMDEIGAQELHLPAMNPIEIWDETGRNSDFGDEMFRLYDRKKRQMALAPTHEEIICDLARKFIRSYKDMPQMWYQIQNKFRDEPRPRSGVIRSRQFLMKDSYSMDTDEKGLDVSYRLHAKAYKKIFSRCGLKFHIVGASSGLMGGSASQEFMLESDNGEDTLVLCDACDYAANMEVATSICQTIDSESSTIEKIHTPGKKTIEEVSGFLQKQAKQLMKSLVYIVESAPIMVLVRGDHELNESKLLSFLGCEFRPAHPDEVLEICGAEVGFVGPIGLRKDIRIIADNILKHQHNITTGANQNDYHISGLELERDVKQIEYTDLHSVQAGEQCIQCGNALRVTNAIELGHIFKLGTKYSQSMNACYLGQDGKEKPIVMGSYGIGVERIVAASIEQHFDKNGIIWPISITPYLVHIIPIKIDNDEIRETSDQLYNTLRENSIDTIIDDRKATPGYKFKEADLLGMPFQIIIGDKYIKEKKLELKIRKTNETMFTTVSEVVDILKNKLIE